MRVDIHNFLLSGFYAPFLCPIFFALGVGFVIEDMRKKRKDGKPEF
jgi:hypothetical protein